MDTGQSVLLHIDREYPGLSEYNHLLIAIKSHVLKEFTKNLPDVCSDVHNLYISADVKTFAKVL
jgi:hypothetical protein